MNTRKPVSTVSYNTESFLKGKLDSLYGSGMICNYMAIKHLKEDDELKDHWHVYIEPNKQIDTAKLKTIFEEFDPDHDKPLGVQPFRFSKVDKDIHPDDWLLYNLHDPKYLASKGQSRKYHYTMKDIICADDDLLLDNYNHALYHSKWAEDMQQIKEVKECNSVADLYYSGRIPPQLIVAYAKLKDMERLENNEKTFRAGRVTHTPLFKPIRNIDHMI